MTLAKSGKMIPVMIGSILLGSICTSRLSWKLLPLISRCVGGSSYSWSEYVQVSAIICGTCVVSLSEKKGSGSSSLIGIGCVSLSLFCDGLTGGMQQRLKAKASSMGVKPKSYDFMFWTNLFMMIVAIAISTLLGELHTGILYCMQNPLVLDSIVKFALCSAIGQSFIFYTIANFDPLVCTSVTTTRKIFSVLLSIFLRGHPLNYQGWFGVSVAAVGILGELHDKLAKRAQKNSKSNQ